jgi:hypothetical protein
MVNPTQGSASLLAYSKKMLFFRFVKVVEVPGYFYLKTSGFVYLEINLKMLFYRSNYDELNLKIQNCILESSKKIHFTSQCFARTVKVTGEFFTKNNDV